MKTYAEMKPLFARSSFRSRFRLRDADRAYLAEKGWMLLEAQTERFVRMRLASAFPVKDGSQTPMKGHPVFLAQHATACCCRSCLAKWHGIPKGRPLSESEISGIVAMLIDYMRDQAGDLRAYPSTPDLFSSL